MNETKKDREKLILNKVYKNYPLIEILNQDKERPDFWIRLKDEEQYFGVEITERYHSESRARLRKIPNYISELIQKQKYRHKEDKGKLLVTPIIIKDDTNKIIFNKEVVLSYDPSQKEYLESIINIIATKDKKFNKYSKSLKYINLIIYDNENSLHMIDRKDFLPYFLNNETRESIIKSKFREIYYIVKLKDNKEYYIPLKMLISFNDIYLFNHLFFDFYPKQKKKISESYYIAYLIEYLYLLGYQDIFIRNINNRAEIIIASCGFTYIEPEFDIQLSFYRDFKLPSDIVKITSSVDVNLDKTFIDFITKHLNERFINTDIGFETN